MQEVEFHEARAAMTWTAEEVVREVNHRPHLLLRITLRGVTFRQVATVPFMRLVTSKKLSVPAWFTEISAEGDALHGYFPTDVPARGRLEFGYANVAFAAQPAPFVRKEAARLDAAAISKDVINTTRKVLAQQPG